MKIPITTLVPVVVILALVGMIVYQSQQGREPGPEPKPKTPKPVLNVSFAKDASGNCFAYFDSITAGGVIVRSITYMGVALAAANACPP